MELDKFIIASYYTIGTPYVDVCHAFLMPSVTELRLRTDIRGVTNLGSWQKNTSYKPEFIRLVMERHTEDIVFVDSDAEIIRYPELFNNIPEQYCIAAHILDRNAWYGYANLQKRYELLSGTLWIRNCAESRRVLDAWMDGCKATNMWEQKVLQQVLEQLNITPYQLPLSYCYIKTLPGNRLPLINVEEPVIVHNQVSRTLKNRIR
jgi:hypothetical protein